MIELADALAAPVDVRAVMARLELQTLQRGGSPSCETIASARAAISELIEADQEYDSAHDHLRSVKRGWKFDPAFATDEEWAPLRSAEKRLEASIARRAAALGRVQANSHGAGVSE